MFNKVLNIYRKFDLLLAHVEALHIRLTANDAQLRAHDKLINQCISANRETRKRVDGVDENWRDDFTKTHVFRKE